MLGISSVAPAYALTVTIGILVSEAGAKMPVVIIAGFLPMFFAAYAYRELNKVAPDCGTSFTWTTKSLGPQCFRGVQAIFVIDGHECMQTVQPLWPRRGIRVQLCPRCAAAPV